MFSEVKADRDCPDMPRPSAVKAGAWYSGHLPERYQSRKTN